MKYTFSNGLGHEKNIPIFGNLRKLVCTHSLFVDDYLFRHVDICNEYRFLQVHVTFVLGFYEC